MQRPAFVTGLPEEPGVYRFRDGAGRVLYIGRAGNLRRRVASYWGDLGDRGHLRRMVRQIARADALVCASEHEAAWAERLLLEQRLPAWNRTPGGQEVPLHLRLDRSARSAGLTAVHQVRPGPGVEHHGPYLGGRRTRLAVAALLRVYPLHTTATAATAAERDLARLRTDATADVSGRERWADGIGAALRRAPEAGDRARAALVRRRDAAAAAERYEVAARVQDELMGLDWVLAPQRVAVTGGEDADAWAWTGGVRVRAVVRAGHLRAWVQEPADDDGSGVGGDPGWAPFVSRNAALASTLSRLTASR